MLQNSPLYSYIPARDVRRARTFYERTLGFKSKIEINGGVVYEFAKGTACFLYPTPNAGTSQASQAFWEVDDIEREVAELKARGVAFKADKRVGEPASTIVAMAEHDKYDAIALGAQGHSALAHLMMGSIAQKVVASSNVPVLLLR